MKSRHVASDTRDESVVKIKEGLIQTAETIDGKVGGYCLVVVTDRGLDIHSAVLGGEPLIHTVLVGGLARATQSLVELANQQDKPADVGDLLRDLLGSIFSDDEDSDDEDSDDKD